MLNKWFLKWKHGKKKLQMSLCFKESYVLSYCPPYFDKNTSKINKFLAFIQTVQHSILNVILSFFVRITMVFLTILLMLHAFIFFNIGNRYEDRIWKVLKYDHYYVMWLGNLGRRVCMSVCKYLFMCAYRAVRDWICYRSNCSVLLPLQ